MIRAIVVDDEQPSLDKLEKMLKDSGLVEIAGKFTEPQDVLSFLKKNKVDAVFLDIEMPDLDGIELSSYIIDLQERISVIFVTAYNQYAVEAFRLNALDYLMKPVAADRLKETLNRIVGEKGICAYSGELHIQCFGKFKVMSGSCDVKFRTGKAEELLAFLLDRKGSFVSRREIIDSLWEDFEGDRAIINFNTTLHYVKKALRSYEIKISITYNSGGYKLDTEGLNCDYIKFCTFMENAGAVGQENIAEYEEAAGFYIGEYLSGWEYDWVARKRLLLEEQFIDLLLGMVEYYQSTDNYEKAAKWLKAGLLTEPLHREMNYRLIEVLMLTNERAMAVRYYNAYRNGLRNKLNQEPDEAFDNLLR